MGSQAEVETKDAEQARELERLSRLARLLDEAVRIPGTQVRVGLDALIGIIPGAGDALSAAVSAYLIGQAARIGVPPLLIARMVGNLAVDLLVGAVPVAGDLFDIGFRANRRNVELLRRHLARRGVGTKGRISMSGRGPSGRDRPR